MLKKWLIVLAVPLVFQVLFLGALLKSQLDRDEAQRMSIHSKEVLTESATLTRLLIEARSYMLAQVVAGNVPRARVEEAAAAIPVQFAKLHGLVSDNKGQRLLVDEIAAKARPYVAWVVEADRLARTGRGEEAVERFKSTTDRATLAEVRARIDRFLAEEQRLDRERSATLERAVRGQDLAILLGAVVSLATGAGLVLAFSRGFARRIGTLAENARRLAEGKALAEPIVGGDEIGQLDGVFHAMARSLKERGQENEMFIYSVSHDLRSPLVNLQGFSRELAYTAADIRKAVEPLEKPPAAAARLERLIEHDMPDSIHFIQNAVTRLSAIIDSLLRLSRAGRVEYRMQPLDLDATLGRVVEALRDSIAEKGAEVAVDDLPPALGDPTIVEQVFANLLSNAVKYLDPARPGRIEVGAEPDGGDAPGFRTYHVRDNGLGIPEAHQAKLFLAFQRLHPGVAQGEGIGLALVRRMVERHGGKIWAESEAGVGSTFFVTLPASDGTAPTDGPIPRVAATIGAPQ